MSKHTHKGVKQETVIELYNKGLRTAEITKKLGVSPSTVMHHRKMYARATGQWVATNSRTNGGYKDDSLIKDVMKTRAVKLAFQNPRLLELVTKTSQEVGRVFGISSPKSDLETSKILEKL